jgi:hypothetical protein
MKVNDPFMLGYNNPGDQVGVSTKLCSIGLILVGPQCGIFSCPLLAPRILSYLPHFWKIFDYSLLRPHEKPGKFNPQHQSV